LPGAFGEKLNGGVGGIHKLPHTNIGRQGIATIVQNYKIYD